jgi:hypothetical protein
MVSCVSEPQLDIYHSLNRIGLSEAQLRHPISEMLAYFVLM